MNYARKCHEAGSKRVESVLENGTNQARKWHEHGSKMIRQLGSKMAQTRLEKGTNQARKRHEPGLKHPMFVSFRLEAGHAKWLEPRYDRRIDVTQMTCNSVHKARSFLHLSEKVLAKALQRSDRTRTTRNTNRCHEKSNMKYYEYCYLMIMEGWGGGGCCKSHSG